MFNRILVPLDGSSLAERVLPFARELGRAFSSQLELLQVIPPLYTDAGEVSAPQEPAPVASYLDNLAVDLRSAGLKVSTRVQPAASSSEAILERAALTGAKLILLGSHGHTGLERWAFGSTANQVVRHAPCPTLVVPARGEVTPSFGRIVVPVDGSVASEGALELALKLARQFDSQLTLLQSYVMPEQQVQSAVYLKSLAQNTPYEVVCSERCGTPEEVLLEAANEFDLLVMTSHGRNNLARWIIGSVAERVVEFSPKPVLIINREAMKARRAARELELKAAGIG